MSDEADKILTRMLEELGTCKYIYRAVAGGCYEACINNYGLKKPKESKSEIIDKFLKIYVEKG